MLKARTIAPGRMEVVDGPEPVAQAGQAVISVEAVGLCGSDYHLFLGDHPYSHFPNTQGHEFAGIIETFGPGYRGPLRPGERVAVEPLIPDGTCFACRRGRYNCCANLSVLGAHVPGALAERIAVRAGTLYPVGDLPAQTAALVEPVSIGLQGVARAGITRGDRVVVLGAGPIGQAVTLGAADRGAEVLVADRVASRLPVARRLGAARTLDTGRQDLTAAVDAWTGGEGAAAVVDATGAPALIRQAFDVVAPSGTIAVIGISDQEVAIPVTEFSRKEVTVVGCRNNTGLFADAVDLVTRHAARVRSLVTHTFPLDRVPEAVDFALHHPTEVEKVMIVLRDES